MSLSGSLTASDAFWRPAYKQSSMAGVFLSFFPPLSWCLKKRVNNQNSCMFWSGCILQMFSALYGMKAVFLEKNSLSWCAEGWQFRTIALTFRIYSHWSKPKNMYLHLCKRLLKQFFSYPWRQFRIEKYLSNFQGARWWQVKNAVRRGNAFVLKCVTLEASYNHGCTPQPVAFCKMGCVIGM